ncbi:hypothetical protein EST38_g2092 [Candolleomyces aberdarensis]|uniref:Uncharacterized protein n=1 Tax=Candolleomyces aberdarensis TaxID=2316362 RepID=A0A4Q2DWH3_9AGAR|nr:hypothetical protein EST38_g2092 [Candolleomyces aberdarensis]
MQSPGQTHTHPPSRLPTKADDDLPPVQDLGDLAHPVTLPSPHQILPEWNVHPGNPTDDPEYRNYLITQERIRLSRDRGTCHGGEEARITELDQQLAALSLEQEGTPNTSQEAVDSADRSWDTESLYHFIQTELQTDPLITFGGSGEEFEQEVLEGLDPELALILSYQFQYPQLLSSDTIYLGPDSEILRGTTNSIVPGAPQSVAWPAQHPMNPDDDSDELTRRFAAINMNINNSMTNQSPE